jgi:broad specificity phosphatase PhoE
MIEETPPPKSTFRTIIVFSLMFAVVVMVIVVAYFVTFRRQVTTVIIVRHTEKIIDPNNPDVDLSPAGQARAQELARMFGDAGISAIYATQYKRTQETVKPLADKLGLPVTIVNSKNTADLLAKIRAANSGQTVFIAGHNNTVPEIINALGGPSYPTIPESEYDNLFVVTIYRTGHARVVKMKYGALSPPGVGTMSTMP